MKHKRFATGILTLLWAAGTVVMAQAPTPEIEIGTSYGSTLAIPGFLPPSIDQADPVAYWAGNLGLDAGQQASVKNIFADQQSATDALKSNLSRALTSLRAAAKANSVDSEIDRFSADLGSTFAQAVAVQAKAYARFYALLTPDQKQKFATLSAMPAGASLSVFGHAGPGASTKSVKQ
jgi:Spy/CpxP family protein refolding chaperone